MEKQWSPYQQAVFANFEDDTGHAVVRARAGSGKTTTIIKGLDYVPRGRKVLLCAFNTRIRDELAERAPRSVDVKTLHSVGLRALRAAFGEVKVEENKTKWVAKRVVIGQDMDWDDLEEARAPGSWAVAKLAGVAKNLLVPEDDLDRILDLAEEFEIEDERIPPKILAEFAGRTMGICAEMRSIADFDDMIWMPWRHQLRPAAFDLAVVDETQDLNPAQLALARSMIRKSGRIVAVGDDRQAIYQFRGADEWGMRRMIEDLNATVLPLSITYRCPKAVVDLAKVYVPDFEAAPGAITGTLTRLRDDDELVGMVRPGDVVLSRSNAPLMKACLRVIAKGTPACVAGKDIGKTIAELVEKMDQGGGLIPMLSRVRAWRDEQVVRYTALEQPERAERAIDRALIVEAIAEHSTSVADLLARVERLFRDDAPSSRVLFSTVHKAKGLEWDRVFLLSATFEPRKEPNLYYVALTRTKRDLFFVGEVRS